MIVMMVVMFVVIAAAIARGIAPMRCRRTAVGRDRRAGILVVRARRRHDRRRRRLCDVIGIGAAFVMRAASAKQNRQNCSGTKRTAP
jgi:hypothetical protein